MKKKILIWIILVLLLSGCVGKAAPFELLWERRFEGSFPYSYDINYVGLFGFINDKMVVILDENGEIVVNKVNNNEDWIIDVSPTNYLLQDGGDGSLSTAKIYDFEGNMLWKVGDESLGVGSFSPKGTYIVFTDVNSSDFQLMGINGELILKEIDGSPWVVFDDKEEVLSASHVGIFKLKDNKADVFVDDCDLNFIRWESYFVGDTQNLLVIEDSPERMLRFYDKGFSLIWTQKINSSMTAKLVNNSIVTYNSNQIQFIDLEGVLRKTISINAGEIEEVIWCERDLDYVVLLVQNRNNERYLKFIDINGAVLYQEELSQKTMFVFNQLHNTMYKIDLKSGKVEIKLYKLL